MAATLKPDIILIDLYMPGMGGIQATRRLVENNPGVKILVITMFDDDSVFVAMRAGARGYLLKEALGKETLRTIRAVAGGEAIFSPSVAGRLIIYFNAGPKSVNIAFPELSEREREILDLIAQGYTNAAIANKLALSPKTVRNQVSNIFSKLQVADRAEAIIRAREAGLARQVTEYPSKIRVSIPSLEPISVGNNSSARRFLVKILIIDTFLRHYPLTPILS